MNSKEQQLDLKKIERKAYLAYHQDGVWDILAGVAFIGFGLAMYFDQAYFMGIIPAVLIPIVPGIKKAFTRPRLGYARFSPERTEREKKSNYRLQILLTITMIAGLVVFWAFTGRAEWQNWIRSLGMLPFGIVVSVVIGAVGIMYGITRVIIYGALILIFFIAGHYANSEPPAYFILPGIIFLISGLVMMIRFMRKYPRLKEDVNNAVE